MIKVYFFLKVFMREFNPCPHLPLRKFNHLITKPTRVANSETRKHNNTLKVTNYIVFFFKLNKYKYYV